MSGLTPGMIVAERYRVVRSIGAGNVGLVYEVEHIQLGVSFALKILARRFVEVAGISERFAREARTIARIDDPRVVRVMDFGHHEGRPFFVMELLRGESLRAAAERLSPRRIVELMGEVLTGLARAHALGVVHRDLKPENVLVVGDSIKLLDFGLAKVAEPLDELQTAEGAVFGTPRYMSPEQASGSASDARTDVYAVGVMLFELLSGKPPFAATTPSEILRRHIVEPPPPLEVKGSTEGLRLDRLSQAVARALEKNPDDRPESAEALRQGLEAAFLPYDRDTTPIPLAPPPPSRPKVSSSPVASRSVGWERAVGAGLVLLLSGVLIAIWRTGPEEPRADALETPPPSNGAHAAAAPSLAPSIDPATLTAAIQALEEDRIPEARRELGRALAEAGPGARSERLEGLVERWIDTRRVVGLRLLVDVLSSSTTVAFADVLVDVAERAPTFALRRRAFEGLERRELVDRLDAPAYLVTQLRQNGTDSCELRRWYVARLLALDPEVGRPVWETERQRRGGFLGLERIGGCLDDLVDQAASSAPGRD